MALDSRVQGLMTPTKWKQNMHEHTLIMPTSTKNPTSKTSKILFCCKLQDLPYFKRVWRALSINLLPS